MEVVASLSQGRTAAAQCGLFTHKSVPVKCEPLVFSLHNIQDSTVLIDMQEMKQNATVNSKCKCYRIGR